MFHVVVAVNPSEHAVVACLWAFKYIAKPGKSKATVLIVTRYADEKHYLPMGTCYSSKMGQNTSSNVFKEHLEKQLRETYPSHAPESDYQIVMETGCPVESIKNKVIEKDALVLIMGEKHPFSKRNTVWSNTIYKCIMNCPCISLIVRPTCFDIFDTDPLIEIFRHPSFHGDFPIFDFLAGGKETVPTASATKAEPEAKAPEPQPAPTPSKPAGKKDLFGKLLQKKGQEAEAPKAERGKADLADMERMRMVGMAKKEKSAQAGTEDKSQNKEEIKSTAAVQELKEEKIEREAGSKAESSERKSEDSVAKETAQSVDKNVQYPEERASKLLQAEQSQEAIPQSKEDTDYAASTKRESAEYSEQFKHDLTENREQYEQEAFQTQELSEQRREVETANQFAETQDNVLAEQKNATVEEIDEKTEQIIGESEVIPPQPPAAPKEKKGFFKNLLSKDKKPTAEQEQGQEENGKDRNKYAIKDTEMKHFTGPSRRTNQ